MILLNIRTDFNFIFGQFSVARKLILNGGAIRPTVLLLTISEKYMLSNTDLIYMWWKFVIYMLC